MSDEEMELMRAFPSFKGWGFSSPAIANPTQRTVPREVFVNRYIREHGCPHLREELVELVDAELVVCEQKWQEPERVPPVRIVPSERTAITMPDDL